MGIYFRDILLIRISKGANNCGQHSLEKNIYFIMRFSPHFQLFYFNDRLEFCEFFEWKIKRINNADLFSQPPLLIFIEQLLNTPDVNKQNHQRRKFLIFYFTIMVISVYFSCALDPWLFLYYILFGCYNWIITVRLLQRLCIVLT